MDGLSRQIRQRIEQINRKLSEAEKDTLLGGIQKLPEFLKITSTFFRSFEILENLDILGVGGIFKTFLDPGDAWESGSPKISPKNYRVSHSKE